MFVHHNELLWMLRQVDGQRVHQEKIVRKFENHGIYSLFPYFDGIESLFNKSNDKDGTRVQFVSATLHGWFK